MKCIVVFIEWIILLVDLKTWMKTVYTGGVDVPDVTPRVPARQLLIGEKNINNYSYVQKFSVHSQVFGS